VYGVGHVLEGVDEGDRLYLRPVYQGAQRGHENGGIYKMQSSP
jgi:hypothetical protein